MFRKAINRNITTTDKLSNYINGFDIYNSELLYKLSDPDIEYELFEITTWEYRPDMIAKYFYGSTSYTDLVILQMKVGIEDLKKGLILKLIPKSTLDNLINSI